MIDSFIPGRVRLRSPLLRNAECAEIISSGLLSVNGVRKADVNMRTSGLLLEYDPSFITAERMTEAAPLLERIAAAEDLPPEKRPVELRALFDEIRVLLS